MIKSKASIDRLIHRDLLANGRANTTEMLRTSIKLSNQKAEEVFIEPVAKGLVAVRVTLRSIFLSHKSFAIQPAPLVNKPPAIINATRFQEWSALGVSQRDHPAGISRMSLPLGLFHLSNSKKGIIFF